MSRLAEFLRGEPRQIRADSERRKAEKLDWQRAVQELINRMIEWLKESDTETVLKYHQTDHRFDDYDVGPRYELKGLTIILGSTTVRIVPISLNVVGSIQVPGETHRRKFDGCVEFDNGIDRVRLYRVKDGDRDIWLWWSHGGIGIPFDRESFEGAVVSLLQ
jgi:hypothetical protein